MEMVGFRYDPTEVGFLSSTMGMVGFRYDPTDVELMKALMKKVNNAEDANLNHYFIVNDCEVYGESPPWEIYDSHAHFHLRTFHRKLYVFTDLKTTTGGGGNRVCRAAPCGTWLEKSKPKRIFDSQGSVIGIDRMLSFKAKDPHSGKFNKTNWIMHEFSLANQEFGRNNTVLCVIYKLNKGSVCEEAIGGGLKRPFSSDEVFSSCFNTTAASTAVISIEPEPEPEPEEDSQVQEHKKRRTDADDFALTDEEVNALIADLSFLDDPPPLVEVCSQSKSDPVADIDTDGDFDFDALTAELISDLDTTG